MNTTTLTHDIISSDRVEGTSVYDESGEKLGSIDDLMIDKRSGNVRYAVLEFGGFLGMGTDRYPMPWQALKYDTTKEGYVVQITKEQLKGAPHFADGDNPVFTSAYGGQIHDHYGIDKYPGL